MADLDLIMQDLVEQEGLVERLVLAGFSGSTGGNGSGYISVSFPATAPTNGSSGSSGGASGKSIQGVSNVTSSGSGSLTGGTA